MKSSDTLPPSVTDETALFEAALQAMTPDKAAAALPMLQPGLTHFPRSPRLWHAHGLLLRELDRRREALRSLERAQALSPQRPKIAWALAQTRFEAGLPSIEAYACALQLNPNHPDIILGLSQLAKH